MLVLQTRKLASALLKATHVDAAKHDALISHSGLAVPALLVSGAKNNAVPALLLAKANSDTEADQAPMKLEAFTSPL